MDFKLITDTEFRRAARDKKTDNLGVLKGMPTSIPSVDNIKAINEKKRTIDFIISTEAIDRVGDRVSNEGWDLTAFKKNPIVLFGHDRHSPPVAKACNTRRRRNEKQLVSTAEFMSAELSPFADSIFRMYVEGFMKATSVGFVPIEWKFVSESDEENSEDRGPWAIDFEKQELLEYSCVPVPANSEALIDARSKGINTAPIKDWAESVLDAWEEHDDLILPKDLVQSMYKNADPIQRNYFRVSSAKKKELRRENLDRLTQQTESNESTEDTQKMAQTGATSDTAKVDNTPKGAKDSNFDHTEGGAILPIVSADTTDTSAEEFVEIIEETIEDDTDVQKEVEETSEDIEENSLDSEIAQELEDEPYELSYIFDKLLEYTDILVDSIQVGDDKTKGLLAEYAATRAGARAVNNVVSGLRDAADVLDSRLNPKEDTSEDDFVVLDIDDDTGLDLQIESDESDTEILPQEDDVVTEEMVKDAMQEILPEIFEDVFGKKVKTLKGILD